MSVGVTVTEPVSTLPFEQFWNWLLQHPNCILRAGTPETAIFDDEDLHWHFATDGPTLFVQVIRGKRLVGELVLDPERVAYVQAYSEDPEGEFVFELISENEKERIAAYFFVLSHAREEEPEERHGRAVH